MQFEKHIFYDLISLGIDSLYKHNWCCRNTVSRVENNRIARTIQRLPSEVPWHNGETCECF